MRYLLALLVATLPMTALAQGSRTVSGQVSYLDRMALPDDAVLLVEVLGTDGRLIADARMPTAGQQVPVPFAIDMGAQSDVILRAGIMLGLDLVWLGDPVMAVGDAGVDLMLRRYQPLGFTAAFRCGDLMVRSGFADDRLVIDTGAVRKVLDPVPAASGARFEAADGGAVFWNRGDTATLTLDGTDLPDCRIGLPEPRSPYTARGNEPFWTATIDEGQMTLTRLGMDDLSLNATDAALQPDGALVVTATDTDLALRAVLTRDALICRDSMTGLPYPETVSLAMGDEVIRGCGGSTASLLQKRTWVVETVLDDTVRPSDRITLGFDAAGRVAGSSGCNRWFAGYQLTGESLSIRQSGATMMMCNGPVMAQERLFFAAIAQVTGFDLDDSGALLLMGPEGPVITARAATDGSAP
ncbi:MULTISPECIES: META domain-containing protein [unclassified Yoonia]|uniref:META domain-containing protein n=1 Tax=unclassified Yoonia TaxID=2629118 RepID=UPI002AFEEA5E|nr:MULTISPECIES: META domain-containing protein [unclassified Yoonia]